MVSSGYAAGPGLGTLLVATDFSETADRALEAALRLAREPGAARLLLVHARPDREGEPEEESDGKAESRLAERAARAGERGPPVETRLADGTPGSAILDLAAKTDAELIALGTRGHGRSETHALGETARAVAARAAAPVLAVHGEVVPAREGLRTVVLPTDFSPASEAAAATALRLLARAGPSGRLLLVHAVGATETGREGEAPYSAALDAARSDAQRRLAEMASRLGETAVRVEVAVHAGDAHAVIGATAQAAGADLVVMGACGADAGDAPRLGRTAARVLPRALCPVVTVAAGAAPRAAESP